MQVQLLRPACQMCELPVPPGADVKIGTIGIEPQGHLLVIARNEEIDFVRLQDVTDGLAATPSHSIQGELHYRAGDPAQHLPWAAA